LTDPNEQTREYTGENELDSGPPKYTALWTKKK